MKQFFLAEEEWRTLFEMGMWHARPVARNDVIAFFDRVANDLTEKTVVVLDNAGIYRGVPMRDRQAEWERHGLHLLYLPPYCPELNAIEILWKHAKYFWRRFITLTGADLHDEIDALMRGFGTDRKGMHRFGITANWRSSLLLTRFF